ncbi:MAG TPA: gamma-glutamyl-gamma-aminobutyrate hydrolase family protein [Longimicrobiales bacterium]|nr:gamma-glutamyl-gamma-aminobutyrate hydrolase family protein [Longimicrobiales bacterium]
MTARPLIGVPTQTLQAIDGIPEGLPHSWVMNHRYFTALTFAGAAPVMIPLLADEEDALRAAYERLDGVFLAGGVDVDPSSYREDKLDVCGRTDPDRDQVEMLLAKWAIEDGKPVLGVCRGLQVINVACGGTLLQDVEQDNPRGMKHDYFPTQGYARDYLAHDVDIVPDTETARIYMNERVLVNSMHHQGIKSLGAGLIVSVKAPDGLVEGIEGTFDGFCVGVQWHPEMLIETDEGTRRLFAFFVDAALQYSGGVTAL